MTVHSTDKATNETKPTTHVTCAFCSGTGQDPFELLSKLSKCPVCQGHKKIEVEKPTVACGYCQGTGRQRHARLECSGCGGTGVITLSGPTVQCPQCAGSGREHDADLSCSLCRGAGRVAKEIAHKKKKIVAAAGHGES